jgi:hypothetical protein
LVGNTGLTVFGLPGLDFISVLGDPSTVNKGLGGTILEWENVVGSILATRTACLRASFFNSRIDTVSFTTFFLEPDPLTVPCLTVDGNREGIAVCAGTESGGE